MKHRKSVRILKKVKAETGAWSFVSIPKAGGRYFWDARPGQNYLEWWEGPKRRREVAGSSPSEVLETQRRKGHELIGEMMAGRSAVEKTTTETQGTRISEAIESLLTHVQVHSPDKPRTLARYRAVLDHFRRTCGRRYLNPDVALKRAAVNRLHLPALLGGLSVA